MTTSASTTFSPSSRRTTRSTPCVLGCCGPMLITSSLVSNIAPWTVVGLSRALPVLLNVRLFPRLAQLQPVFGHQNAASIGMTGEVDAEHVVDLALEPVGGRPDGGRRRHRRVLTRPD